MTWEPPTTWGVYRKLAAAKPRIRVETRPDGRRVWVCAIFYTYPDGSVFPRVFGHGASMAEAFERFLVDKQRDLDKLAAEAQRLAGPVGEEIMDDERDDEDVISTFGERRPRRRRAP